MDTIDSMALFVLAISKTLQVRRQTFREGGVIPPRARRCDRGRKPQMPLSVIREGRRGV